MPLEPKQRRQKPQLRVVFDSNALYTSSASDLVQQEVANLIGDSQFPDIEIKWYLPEVVRHERQYQMQKRALELIPHISKVEKLLGHNLAINESILRESVQKAVDRRQEELDLVSLPLDYAQVDWHAVAIDAAYRNPPFQDGEKEKGFRDRLIVECFLQLVDDSPKTASLCRIVLLTADTRLAQAVSERIKESSNAAVLGSLEELKGLINTLASRVDEAFLASLKQKAQKLFFVPENEATLFYKEQVRQKLTEKFAQDLAALPPGATGRRNGTWRISPPNFVKKDGRRIQWVSRVSIDTEAFKSASAPSAIEPTTDLLKQMWTKTSNIYDYSLGSLSDLGRALGGQYSNINVNTQAYPGLDPVQNMTFNLPPPRTVTTHKGTDSYEVLWSSDVTTAHDLRRPTIDELKHLAPEWESVT